MHVTNVSHHFSSTQVLNTKIFTPSQFMKMTVNGRARAALVSLLVWFLLNSSCGYSVESDVECLKAVRGSLKDPLNYLNSSWNFNNKTEGFICKFVGIDCWHADENRVLNIHLSDMGLEGEFPRGLENCSSLTGLDLSSNKLHGNIPSNIANILPFVTNVDLSSNKFSGEIPSGFANCSYLNFLKLDKNQLTGEIPAQIGHFPRIKTFSVANNQLTGPVPNFSNANGLEMNFASNPGLCGDPLPPCKSSSKKKQKMPAGVIVGAAVTGVTISAVLVLAGSLVYVERRDRKG